ncbi:MAG: helix-turn-helix domain-containing protein [Chloroflexi bacterium]|nr:helix-turn-helix domain-containing protein [Chloroflexota bacterium]
MPFGASFGESHPPGGVRQQEGFLLRKPQVSAHGDHALVMPKIKPAELAAEAQRTNMEQLARLGGEVRTSRRRRRLTQQQLADLAGISRSAESRIELGRGGGHTLDTWQRLGLALERPLSVALARDALDEPDDVGHLAMQELVLRLGRARGLTGSFELRTRPAEPWRSTDVGLRDNRRRLLVLFECWNTFGDVGAAARSTNRKIAEAEDFGVVVGGETPYRVASCWVVRATKRNRALVARYPEVFAARFPGSSVGWVRYINGLADEPPPQQGLVWCDVATTRVFPWRRRGPG